ncbi:MAG: glycosyltransferase family 4 protein [Candidatus Methanoperedens sp.]|nr:glycosyltransferase family 4 protein [Candidatus Methanoperedens sp.]PKP54391.1 MAG: hypothetical protein CVT90_01505 [Candidatus Altiarchaeales archaeon HGW-Altiarchaeales-3]
MSKTLNQLRILHLGDMARVGYRLTKLLRKNGISADYLYYDEPYHYDDQKKEPWHHSFKTSQSSRFNKIKVIKESIHAIKKYDIIHAHSSYSIPLLFSFAKKPFIMHLHGTDTRVYAKEHSLIGVMLRRTLKKANKILVSTPDLINEVALFRKDAVFLPNPVDFDTFQPKKSPIDIRGDFEFVVFHPAHHSLTKRNDILIKAFSEVINQGFNARLVMVEWGSLLKESKDLVEKLGITKNVKWIQRIEVEKMVDYYNASDVVCDQFSVGQLGLVSLEAMACGKPVITKYSEVAGTYSSKPPVLSSDNEKAITKNIIHLIENPSERTKIGSESLKWVKNEHSEKKIFKILIKSYEYMVKK